MPRVLNTCVNRRVTLWTEFANPLNQGFDSHHAVGEPSKLGGQSIEDWCVNHRNFPTVGDLSKTHLPTAKSGWTIESA
jgi:hypothetical protein